ncbi:hypothetical protein AAFF_G00064040 [Aldrovandia affinis]|uniref:Uncharacterized protein n=1 Tax=Aldrovandia affinis TaxID=143900 RepID=A0AAD7T3R2_9TELE|nr:hypothetical protein AAFF_G00064040 [Aldrovandia affinis]
MGNLSALLLKLIVLETTLTSGAGRQPAVFKAEPVGKDSQTGWAALQSLRCLSPQRSKQKRGLWGDQLIRKLSIPEKSLQSVHLQILELSEPPGCIVQT